MNAKKVNPMDNLRQLPENKKCFDCHEKGTMYVVMNFGVFVCSTCAGIHREFSHKVKGISMCNFNDEEVKTLTVNGNANQQKKLMGEWSAKSSPEPPKSETWKMKEFFNAKYKEQRFAVKDQDDSDDSDAPKRSKKSKKSKAKKKKKRVETSSEEESEEEKSDESEEAVKPAKHEPKSTNKRRLGAPPSSSGLQPLTAAVIKEVKKEQKFVAPPPRAAAMKAPVAVAPKQAAPVVQTVDNLLDFGGPSTQSAPAQAAQNNDGWADWGSFEQSTPAPQQTQPQPQTQAQAPQPVAHAQPQQVQQQQQFQQPSQPQQQQAQPTQTSNLLDSLSSLYGNNNQPQQQQQQQANFQPMHTNMAQTMSDPFNDYMRSNSGANPLYPQQNLQQPTQNFNNVNVPAMNPGMNPMQPNQAVQQQQMMYAQQVNQLNQRMAQMQAGNQGGANNPMMQQMQAQMQNMMKMMQNMMISQPGAQQQQQQPMPNGGAVGYAQPQIPVQQMQMPVKDDKLGDIFNSMASKPVQRPGQPAPMTPTGGASFNPFDNNAFGGAAQASTPTAQQQQQQPPSFNPFD